MGFLGKIGSFLTKLDKGGKSAPMQKSYSEAIGVNNNNADWLADLSSPDAQAWQHRLLLQARMRDLAETNPYFGKWFEELWANVYGEQGIMLRSKVKETEDRVVHAPDEKNAILLDSRRRAKVLEWVANKSDSGLERMVDRALKIQVQRQDEIKNRGTATIQVGELDVFANKVIEAGWKEWKRSEFCDSRGVRDYNTLCQIRIKDCSTDGSVFIVPVKGKDVNKFGYTLRHVNAEYCDYTLNRTLDNGNEIRMGIEWSFSSRGLGKPVAFWFVKRQPKDWQRGRIYGGGYNGSAYAEHDRIEAKDVIHYARYRSNESTRPMPWGAAAVQTARQLSEYEKATLISARVGACKMGWFESTNPEGGDSGSFDPHNPTQQNIDMTPGGFYSLPQNVKFTPFDPTDPNGNYEQFRKGQIRSVCAGLPGANYNIIANDAEGISYSTGRIFSLDDRELWKLLQRFDINTGERPIFEGFLDCALTFGAIPLPLAKYAKFNQPHFSGRRWDWVDPMKDAKGIRERLLLALTSRSRECDDLGRDFDEIIFEIAEDEMIIAQYGLDALSINTIAADGKNLTTAPVDNEEEADNEPVANGAAGKGRAANGNITTVNGSH